MWMSLLLDFVRTQFCKQGEGRFTSKIDSLEIQPGYLSSLLKLKPSDIDLQEVNPDILFHF